MNKSEVYAGRPVFYWKTISANSERNDPSKSEITSSVIIDVDGVPSCMIQGEKKPIPIANLDTISPGSVLSARLKGCAGLDDASFKKATQNFFEDRGINIKFT